MDTTLKIQEYILSAAPCEWWDYAQELKDSSEELWKFSTETLIAKYNSDTKDLKKQQGVSRTYMFIIGVCLENLFKGILIAETPGFVKDGKIDNSISSGHNVYELSTKVKTLKFTKAEKTLLKILSDAIPYWGKYPIPKKFEQIKQQTVVTPDIRATFLSLYQKLERAIYDSTKFGWTGPNDVNAGEWFVSTLEDLPEGHSKMSFDELYKLRRGKQKSA